MPEQTTTAAPTGWMENAKGHLVPESTVTPIDKLRDQTVRGIAQSAQELHAILKAWKLNAFADVAAFLETSAEQYGVTLRGAAGKGNVTLSTFDGRFRVVRQVQDTISFDERLMAAKALIDECLTEWSANSNDNLKVLVEHAFQVNKEGNISTDRVLGLRRLNITDPKWQRAMDAISDSIQVGGSRSYIRVYERVGDSDKYQVICLDLAAL